MRTAFIVPIQPLAERYTESWYRNFPGVFASKGVKVVVVEGTPLTDHVAVGTFLDINSMVSWNSSQMQHISSLFHQGKVNDGDIFFFGDLEFWGIESLRLLAQLNKVKVKIFGFLHAASYTREDAFEVAAPYQKYTELGWVGACDKVFVGTDYHKWAVYERRIKPLAQTEGEAAQMLGKIVVTGNPLFEEDYARYEGPKENKVVLPNRFDWEKRPNLSLDFAYLLKRRRPDVEIVVTTSRPTFKSNRSWLVEMARAMEKDGIITIMSGLSKHEYHRQLATSKVMLTNSIEENFGYCIVEACIYNTHPLMKRGLSHTELARGNDTLLFDDGDEILGKVEAILDTHSTANSVKELATPFFGAADRIARECLN